VVDPIPGRYQLEVTSPGLERNLRTPAHYQGAVGTDVKVRTHPHVEGDRRAGPCPCDRCGCGSGGL